MIICFLWLLQLSPSVDLTTKGNSKKEVRIFLETLELDIVFDTGYLKESKINSLVSSNALLAQHIISIQIMSLV